MIFGKQHRYCPNCGRHIYDGKVSTTHVQSLMCSDECRNEWSYKYAAMVLGKDADPNWEPTKEHSSFIPQ